MPKLHPCLAFIAALVILAPAARANWEISATSDASLEITFRDTPVVSASYRFWGQQWKWARPHFRLEKTVGGTTSFSGAVPDLGLKVAGTVRSPGDNQLRYTWTMDAERDLKGIMGGGLEFKLALTSPALGGKTQDPILLEGNRGWRWAPAGNAAIQVEFDPAIARVYFEQGNKNTIRAMFVGENVSKGTQTVSMTITLPPGGMVAQSLAERYGAADTKHWYVDALAHDRSPVDLSFLNDKPAGKRGFVRAEGDRLVFGDGSEARFWGGNLAAYAISSEKEQIEVQARRIAQLGFNLMRIHHHDSTGWVSRAVIDRAPDDSQHLDDDVMDRLDYWIKCLRDEGVYVWLDLHVGRMFKQGDDVGEGFAEMTAHAKRKRPWAEGKGYCYFNDRLEKLMQEFNERYLSHVNRYTGLAYKDDPAIMGVLLTNENDLTCHFGNLMLPDKHNPYHNRLFEAAAKEFAARHGLDPGHTGRTWEPGPAKLFLADWEYRWDQRMLGHLNRLGVRAPMATTQMWGGMPLCGLPPLTAGGIIDVHSYGGAEALSANPRFESNYVGYIASGQVYGKPLAITEWNTAYPTADRFTAPLYVASIAALQGWDAPMIYNYSQESFGRPTRPGTWSTFPDPALTGLMPAAALVFRQAHVAAARDTYCLMLDRQGLYERDTQPKNSATLRTLVEQSRVTIGLPAVKELDWQRPTQPSPDVKTVTDLDRDFIPAGQDFVRSDTGELMRNWADGYQTIDTDMTQAAHGWIGGQKIRLRGVDFQIATPKAAVAVSALDSQPIGRSRRMLVTAIARVVASADGKMPLLSEPVKGQLSIPGPEGLRLIPLGTDGKDVEPLLASYTDGRYQIKFPLPRGTHWFLLSAGE